MLAKVLTDRHYGDPAALAMTIAGVLRRQVEADDALGAAANQHFQLLHDPAAFDRAATAMRARLDSAST